jgi:broad specificity phosphatase PhoE
MRQTAADAPPKETRVLLLRHAETSDPDRFHGAESDVGLGENGRIQALAVAKQLAELEPAAVYSSGMRRARETAEAIAVAAAKPLQIIGLLHERIMGPLSGAPRLEGWPTYQEAKARWMSGEITFTHQGGESYRAIRERVVPIFQQLAERHRGETIVVVAHGVVIRVLLTSLVEGLEPKHFDAIPIEFVGVNDLRWDGVRWRAINLRLASDS